MFLSEYILKFNQTKFVPTFILYYLQFKIYCRESYEMKLRIDKLQAFTNISHIL